MLLLIVLLKDVVAQDDVFDAMDPNTHFFDGWDSFSEPVSWPQRNQYHKYTYKKLAL